MMHLAQTDVVVVGGGVAGAATAFALRQRGFDVVLVEQRFLAFGASGRNVGGVWAQDVVTQAGLDDVREAHAIVDRLRDEHGVRVDFERTGGVQFATTDSQAEALRERVGRQRALGLDIELVSGADARAASSFVPEHAIAGAVCAEDARLDLPGYVRELAAEGVRQGVRVYENTTVLNVIRYGDEVAGVATVRGDIRASAVVWAAGPWVQPLVSAGITLPVTPVRVGMLQTQPTSAVSRMIARSCQSLADPAGEDQPDVTLIETFVQTGEGRILVGSSYDFADSLNPHLTGDAAHKLIGAFHERMPHLGSLGVTGLWAGIVGMTADRGPIIDRVEGVYVNTAHVHGARTAVISGEHVARLIAGETSKDELDRFGVDRDGLRAAAATISDDV
jgi:glycine/D-amino acid oxidase-like deaminating enzyme